MSRLSHLQQQQIVDDALASLPSARWRWLFTPDPRWLASVNTTTLREVNAVRMFVATTALFILSYSGVVSFALLRCGVLIRMFNMTLLQILPPSGKLTVEQWKACEESLATGKMLEFADSLFNGYSLLLAAMATVAVGSNILKRVTDTPHRVAVEEAKKAPIIMPVTSEHPAQNGAPTNQINVGVPVPPLVADPPPEPADDHEWKEGDAKAGVV